jgi:nitroimidazol reductase NimA-like FMN-containing flavoprotein (pyridoxamine 5'-phosphate oxidase superfamily)
MSAPQDADQAPAELDPTRCRHLLAAARVSRVAFVDGGLPQLVVLNHLVEGDDVVFQTSAETRLARLTAGGAEIPVTIEADSTAASLHTGWSIVASGRLSRAAETDVEHRPSPWRPDAVGVLLRLEVQHIQGQVVGS